MGIDRISVRGARQHNLKNIDVDIPRDKLTVITGLSGSGKSSLAFDTIYAEGQRRYVESLSAYARQFLDQLEKPHVDSVEGLSPAISIEQKTVARSPRSTIGTVTEIYDYLRLLFSSIGQPHCPQCGQPITRQSVDQILQSVLPLPEGERELRHQRAAARAALVLVQFRLRRLSSLSWIGNGPGNRRSQADSRRREAGRATSVHGRCRQGWFRLFAQRSRGCHQSFQGSRG